MTASDVVCSDIWKSDLIGEESGADHFSEPQDPTSKNTKANLYILLLLVGYWLSKMDSPVVQRVVKPRCGAV